MEMWFVLETSAGIRASAWQGCRHCVPACLWALGFAGGGGVTKVGGNIINSWAASSNCLEQGGAEDEDTQGP